jgi:hypothetical protein
MCMAGSQGGVRLGNELSELFPIHSGLRQGDALSPLIFNLALEYAIQKVGIVVGIGIVLIVFTTRSDEQRSLS